MGLRSSRSALYFIQALLTIVVEITGPILIISGRYVSLGAGMLGFFKGLADLLVNRVLEMTRDERFVAINGFFEHIALIAGFILAALVASRNTDGGRRSEPKLLRANAVRFAGSILRLWLGEAAAMVKTWRRQVAVVIVFAVAVTAA